MDHNEELINVHQSAEAEAWYQRLITVQRLHNDTVEIFNVQQLQGLGITEKSDVE